MISEYELKTLEKARIYLLNRLSNISDEGNYLIYEIFKINDIDIKNKIYELNEIQIDISYKYGEKTRWILILPECEILLFDGFDYFLKRLYHLHINYVKNKLENQFKEKE